MTRLLFLRLLGLVPMARYGSLGQMHRRPDQQTDAPPSAVAPTQAAGILRARAVVIFGTGASAGMFVYNGTPALGNPPQVAIVPTGVTSDPFGNAITSSKILIQGNVITESGGIFRTAATAPLIQLDGPHDALLIYDSASVLRETAAPVATTDGLGSTVQPGFTAYQNNSIFAQIVATAVGAFFQMQSGAASTAPMQIRSTADSPGSQTTISTEQYPADGGANQLNLHSPASPTGAGLMEWTGASFKHSGTVFWYGPSGDATGAKDTAAINNAFSAAFKEIHLMPGTYSINAALTPPTNSSLIGAGAGNTVINQVTNAAEGITCTNKSTVTLRGFTLVGKGSGVSTAAGIHFSSNPATANHILDDIIVQNFGLQGFLFDSVFLTELRKCEALQNGGNGFQVTNSFASPTSFSFHTCYANGNLGTYGYELDALQYSSLSGCAADNNATGYGLLGCQGVILQGCGTEVFTATGFLFNNCKGCGLYSGFTFNGKTKVAWVTNGTTRQTIGGLTETSPAAGATACVQTDAATSSVLWGITHVTADSLTAGTFTNVDGSA